MKKSIIILSLVMSFVFANETKAQTHPTVEKIEVSYKAVPQGTATSLANIQCIPQATITLHSSNDISKVYLRIINPQTNAVVFQVNYPMNASTTSNQNGFKLFEVSGDKVYISSGEQITLKPYLYEIKTENNQNVISTVYTVTK